MKKKLVFGLGFTMAEVLITIIVIGIVAAITVPMLRNSLDGREWNVGRQKALATIGEAFRMMTINGEITDKIKGGADHSLTTEYMATKILPKYLKLAKTCGSGAAAAGDCGFKIVEGTPKVKRPDGVEMNLPLTFSNSTDAYGVTQFLTTSSDSIIATKSTTNSTTQYYDNSYFFKTLDGYSVNFFYNPYCASDKKDKPVRWYANKAREFDQLVLDIVCFNAVYDMNGKKGPNQVGKDIGFVGSIYNGYSVKVAAVLPNNRDTQTSAIGSGDDYLIRAINYCNFFMQGIKMA